MTPAEHSRRRFLGLAAWATAGMIDKRFADEGIAIAFPQRELRIDATRPIRVEMVAPLAADVPRPAAPAQALKKVEGKPAP